MLGPTSALTWSLVSRLTRLLASLARVSCRIIVCIPMLALPRGLVYDDVAWGSALASRSYVISLLLVVCIFGAYALIFLFVAK